LHVGAGFSATGFLFVLNELAIIVSPAIIFAGYLLKLPQEKVDEFKAACNTLRATCTEYVRATNYRDMMRDLVADTSDAKDQT
jgi:hypothetical protein